MNLTGPKGNLGDWRVVRDEVAKVLLGECVEFAKELSCLFGSWVTSYYINGLHGQRVTSITGCIASAP